MHILLIITIILFNMILFCNTVNNALVIDDIRWSDSIKKKLHGFKFNKNLFTEIKYRLYGLGTLYNSKTKKLNLFHEHLVRIALHSLAAILIYLILGCNEVSFIAAILYSANPINNQTSLWLNGRRYIVNGIISLLIFAHPIFLLFYPLAMSLHPSAIFSPILQITNIYSAAISFIIIAVLAYKFKNVYKEKIKYRLKLILSPEYHKKFSLEKVIVVVKSYGFYFFRMIIPGRCFMIYPDLYHYGNTAEGTKDAYSFNSSFFRGIAALLISVVGIVYFSGFNKLLFIYMCIAILQHSNIILSQQILADRYAAIPTIFMMYFVSLLSDNILGVNKYYLLAPLLLYYIVKLSEVKDMYKDIESFYDYHNFYQKYNTHCNTFKASWFMVVNRTVEAFAILFPAYRKNPTDFNLCFTLARCTRMMGDYPSALQLLDKAEKNKYFDCKGDLQKLIDQERKVVSIATEAQKIKQGTSSLSSSQRKEFIEKASKHGLVNV